MARENAGGAGGIRTHEWRFCRPLPWATWVPRRTFEYNKFSTANSLSGRLRFVLLFRRNWRCQLRLTQESRGFFRRRWIDVETRSPFESGYFGQLRDDLDVPV